MPFNNCNGFLSEVDPRIASSLSNPAGRAWFDSHVGRPLVSVTDDLLRAALSCWHILQPSNRAESVRS